MIRTTSNNIQSLRENEIFVFGSNANGRHDGGAARIAVEKFGAIYGQGGGLQGKSYAIDSMSGLDAFKMSVGFFVNYALTGGSDKILLVTEIGCGIAGYTPEQIAPLFKEASHLDNVFLPERFWNIINTL